MKKFEFDGIRYYTVLVLVPIRRVFIFYFHPKTENYVVGMELISDLSGSMTQELKQAIANREENFFPYLGTAEFSQNETSLLLQKHMIEKI